MICLVTDRRRLSPGGDAIDRLVELVDAAVRAGVDLVQVRERDLDARALAAVVRRCVAAAEGSRTKIVVNDRADVAMSALAAGVHLRADSVAVSAARSLLGAAALVGRSVHTAGEAGIAARAGADYLIFGTLFRTPSKTADHPLSTLDDLRAACLAAENVPVLAIGGITLERAAGLVRLGAAGVAGVGLFVPPPGVSFEHHLPRVAAALRRAFDTCEAVT
jgi:thiamine-phosphate pyrophosphorylase